MTSARTSVGRSVALVVLGVVAVVGATGAVVGTWAIRAATDSDRFEQRITEVLQHEEVSDALAERVVNELVAAVPVGDAVAAVVPDLLEPTVRLLLAGARSQVEDRLAETIRDPEVAAGIGAAAGRAHASVVDVLEGRPLVDGVSVEDGAVRVNLLPLTARALRSLQELGLYQDVVVPDFGFDGDPASQRLELEVALGRELPADFGEPIVFRDEALDRLGDTVELARDALLLAKRFVWLLLGVGVVLSALTIAWSRHRWRAASMLVAGVFAATLAIRIVVGRATDRVPDAVSQPGAKATVTDVVEGLERSLRAALAWYCGAALIALLVAAVVVARPGPTSSESTTSA